ncbi:YpbS family protein [Paenibacillus sp. MZ04-78.2]|uniref:DUF2533 family protein n=1 Tax=Paenibacillus sp. MZ04-78.2 TaxID=2962034 RepID=UPI0020B669F7|nr:DUF2533 family protein [Paenibacillus sp. MZ04-78.2]MCP3775606.1 YpbS family protein [Paenibacillus sp. MZ04-78.2]
MKNVHEAITNHTRKQNAHLERFLELENERETAIEEAIALCIAGEPFNVDAINAATDRINRHARNGISPTRVHVTPDMVREAARKQMK